MQLKAFFFFYLLLSIACLNAQHAKLVLPEGHTEGVRLMDYSPEGKYLITATSEFADRTARVWEIKSGKLIYSLKGHIAPIANAEFSPDGKYILTNTIMNYLWDAEKGTQINIYDTIYSYSTCFSKNSKQLIFANYNTDTISFWDI